MWAANSFTTADILFYQLYVLQCYKSNRSKNHIVTLFITQLFCTTEYLVRIMLGWIIILHGKFTGGRQFQPPKHISCFSHTFCGRDKCHQTPIFLYQPYSLNGPCMLKCNFHFQMFAPLLILLVCSCIQWRRQQKTSFLLVLYVCVHVMYTQCSKLSFM